MKIDSGSEAIFRAEDLQHQQLRVLLLVEAASHVPGNARKLDGLTKLAKLDFLARYREFESLVAAELGLPPDAKNLSEDIGITAAPMTKFRYGPWDDQYYPVIGALVGRGLARYVRGKQGSVGLALTKEGSGLASRLRDDQLWRPIAKRYDSIADRFGEFTGNKLKDAIYAALPEKMDTRYGTELT